MADYTAADLALALQTALQRVREHHPRQTLPDEVLLDGATLFLGELLSDMARASQLTLTQRQVFVLDVCTKLARAVEAAHRQRESPAS